MGDDWGYGDTTRLMASVVALQGAGTASEADALARRIELRVLPCQVLQDDAPALADALIGGLATASPHGTRETWEILAQLAAGCVQPTATNPWIVVRTRVRMPPVVDAAISRISTVRDSDAVDYLAVDVLDACLAFCDLASSALITRALGMFAVRGAAERRSVHQVLGWRGTRWSNRTAANAAPMMELDEDTVEQVMRLLLRGAIDRTVACRFVAPWVEGDLPSTRRAESGAQTIHGLDMVSNGGRMSHPIPPDGDHDFVVDEQEMVRRCEAWLEKAGHGDRPLYRLVDASSGTIFVTAHGIEGFFVAPDDAHRDRDGHHERAEDVRLLGAVGTDALVDADLSDVVLEVVSTVGPVVGTYYLGPIDLRPGDGRAGLVPGPLDVTFHTWTEPHRAAGEIWRRWASGRPIEPGEWLQHPVADHDSWLHVVRSAWSMTGYLMTRYGTDAERVVDGRQVLSEAGLYCALGEAVNGPGGYFGSNLDALDDCLWSSLVSRNPFRVVFEHSSTTIERIGRSLVMEVVETLQDHGVEVTLA